MRFTPARPDMSYPLFRLESLNKRWEMGLYPTIYGTRVSCGITGGRSYMKGGYCCGMQGWVVKVVSACLLRILSDLDEGISYKEVDALLPGWDARPINKDDGLVNLINRSMEFKDLDPQVHGQCLKVIADVSLNLHKVKIEAQSEEENRLWSLLQ